MNDFERNQIHYALELLNEATGKLGALSGTLARLLLQDDMARMREGKEDESE